MVSHLFYYQLALLALVWLFLMLPVTWRKRGVTPPPASAQPEPRPPKRTRAHEPTPFEGLTHKPPCALCERDAAQPQSPLPVVVYPSPADNCEGPLPCRLPGVNQLVISTANGFSTLRSTLLAYM